MLGSLCLSASPTRPWAPRGKGHSGLVMSLSVRETQDKICYSIPGPGTWWCSMLAQLNPMTTTRVASPVNPGPMGSVPRTKSAVGTEVQERKQQTPPPSSPQRPAGTEQAPRTSRGLSMPHLSEGTKLRSPGLRHQHLLEAC